MATQIQLELPLVTDLSEGARAKWVWGLSRLSRSLTTRAVGWLSLATSDEDWQEALGELQRDGRFTAEWMTSRRITRAAARAQAEQRRRNDAGYDERATNLEVWAHISGVAATAVALAVAKPKLPRRWRRWRRRRRGCRRRRRRRQHRRPPFLLLRRSLRRKMRRIVGCRRCCCWSAEAKGRRRGGGSRRS